MATPGSATSPLVIRSSARRNSGARPRWPPTVMSRLPDSYEVAEAVARYSRRAGANIDVLIEIDTGLRRTGVMPGPAAGRAR